MPDPNLKERNFKIRRIEEEDFETVAMWRREHNEPALERNAIPLISTYIVEDNNCPVLCLIMYLTNGPVVWAEHLVSDPYYLYSTEAMDWVTPICDRNVKTMGYQAILCITNKPGLKKRYEQLGYEESPKGASVFMKIL